MRRSDSLACASCLYSLVKLRQYKHDAQASVFPASRNHEAFELTRLRVVLVFALRPTHSIRIAYGERVAATGTQSVQAFVPTQSVGTSWESRTHSPK